ncbi:MAG: hypothetical protein IPN84_09275 [Sphingomonadales bacterium]|nr:hypothetical protein [Sphingomonadales bacterium]
MKQGESPPEKSRRDWELEEQAYYEQEEAARAAEVERIADEREAAIEHMASWFFDNFEDPQNEMHYDSEDGVYLYPYGGPFDAADMLSSFSNDYPNEEWIRAALSKKSNTMGHLNGHQRRTVSITNTPKPMLMKPI